MQISVALPYEVQMIHLVPRLSERNSLRAIAEWQLYPNLLELNALFNFDERRECLANSYNERCGNMEVSIDTAVDSPNRTEYSSLITVRNIAKYNYLFFTNILGDIFSQSKIK